MAGPSLHEELPAIRKAARRATWMTLASGLVVLGALGYSSYQISQLDQTVADRLATIKSLSDDIDQKQATAHELETRLHDLTAAVKLIPKQQFDQAVEKSASTLRPRVYLHIAQESQRPDAEKLATALKAAGFDVPGIENVGKVAPRQTQVRYFSRTDGSTEATQGVMKVLKASGIDAVSHYLSLPQANVRDRHLEVWFGSGRDPKMAY